MGCDCARICQAMKLNVATCQFPTSGDIDANRDLIVSLMKDARWQGADVAHFPEACLSGYAGNDIDTNEHVDWVRLVLALQEVMDLAAELQLWVVVGSAHRLTPPHKPHNSL